MFCFRAVKNTSRLHAPVFESRNQILLVLANTSSDIIRERQIRIKELKIHVANSNLALRLLSIQFVCFNNATSTPMRLLEHTKNDTRAFLRCERSLS